MKSKNKLIFRLEYNQNNGFFHFEDILKKNEDTNGYKTICNNLSCENCKDFIEFVNNKYNIEVELPTFEIILLEFEEFLKS
jgi:hypothetical protein